MSIRDYFKKTVWDSFSASGGITADFVIKAVIAMAVALLLGYIIYKIYGRFYGGVVYSASFAVTLIGLTVLTCMLTLAISSNIVISLGMVGALSIVRYRTAIKDPMDLLYLFWAISVGITLAAGLYVLAALTMVVMILIVYAFYYKRKKGLIYILIVHYEGDTADEEILRCLSKLRYQVKSKTIRSDTHELTVELLSNRRGTGFLEKINALQGVKDVNLIQYNGEYNG
ncbi:MAG: DUF4956 domain-containing protein, partial [Candidatus Spyradocola sp.]